MRRIHLPPNEHQLEPIFAVKSSLLNWTLTNTHQSWHLRVYTIHLSKGFGAGCARKLGMTLRHISFAVKKAIITMSPLHGTSRFYSKFCISHLTCGLGTFSIGFFHHSSKPSLTNSKCTGTTTTFKSKKTRSCLPVTSL